MEILIGNLCVAVASVLGVLLSALSFIIIARVILDWLTAFGVLRLNPGNPLVRMLEETTEPAFRLVRRYIRPIGALDLSPLILLLAIMFIQQFVVQSLLQFGARYSGGF